MKKSNILSFILGAIVFGSISVVSAYAFLASDISYTPKDTSWEVDNVKDAVDDLHTKLTSPLYKKVCHYVSNEFSFDQANRYSVGTKYECDPGDGVKRNFYILTVKNGTIDLLMEEDISSGTMAWRDAVKYFITGAGASIKSNWTNVINVDLPGAQAIADNTYNNATINNGSPWIASDSGETWFCMGSHQQDSQSLPHCTNSNQSKYAWLYNHTINCLQFNCTDESNATSYGYWTKDSLNSNNLAWAVFQIGYFGDDVANRSIYRGVRPIITVSTTNLY